MDRKTVERTRLALFGRMIMGVAHEVDNQLSVVLGFAELLQISGASAKKALDSAAKIYTAGEKIGAIVKQFAVYVRPHPSRPEPFTPGEIIKDIFPFSRYDLGRGNVQVDFPEDMPACMIMGDRRDFALALLLLLFNGVEAMAGKGGTLRLAVSRDGDIADLTVTDEGGGVPPEAMPRLFEEGFTLKDGSVHAGMGLPVARHLIGEMGGTVTLENRPGGGCAATIRVPVK